MASSLLDMPDFEQEARQEAERVANPPETFSRADVDQMILKAETEAADLARQEGHAQGRAEALEEIEAAKRDVMQALVPAVTDLLEAHERCIDDLEAEMVRFMELFCEKLFPDLLDQMAEGRLQRELALIARRALGSPWLEITVPVGAAELGAALQVPDGREIDVKVHENEELGAGEIHARWQNGRSSYSMAALCAQIIDLLKAGETQTPEG